MRPDRQLYSPEYLHDGFTLSTLWGFREELVKFRQDLESIQQSAMNLYDFEKASNIENQLRFVEQNIDRIELTMILKENDIFLFTGFGEMCLN